MKDYIVSNKALDLYKHTTLLISNEKIFVVKYASLIDTLDYESIQIYHCIRSANEDFDNRIKEEAKERIKMQGDAIKHCRWLKTYIVIAAHKFHLRAKKVVFWNKLVNEVMRLTKEWQKSEKIGIAALDKIDHFVKEVLRVKYYIRYMDDMILIHKSKEFLLESLEKIKGKLHLQKMQENQKKTKIFDLAKPVKFLGFVYHLTKTGKVYVLADPKKIKHEKKKITRMINLVRTGKLRKYDVDRHFKAYKASVRYGNSHKLLQRLNTWYCAQWEDFENGNH